MKLLKFILAAFLTVMLLQVSCQGQSFAVHKRVSSKDHDKQCHAVHHRKTLRQQTMNKIRYASKRQNNEGFAQRERRRKVKMNSL